MGAGSQADEETPFGRIEKLLKVEIGIWLARVRATRKRQMKTYPLNSSGVLKRYDYLWPLSRDRWAWEYARRNPKLRRDAELRSDSEISEKMAPCAPIRMLRSRVPQRLAERWGLVFMPDPDLNGLEADAVWNKHVYPDQVEINCSPRAPGQNCDIWDRTVPICDITHVTDLQAREFLLVRGKGCVVQVRCTGTSLIGLEPVRMKLTISDLDDYERKVKTQKAALALVEQGPITEIPLWTKTTQILRDGLVALDCLELGMSRRDIAVVLNGKDAVEAEWGLETGTMKDAIRYIVRKAEGLRDGGYLVELLGAQTGLDLRVA